MTIDLHAIQRSAYDMLSICIRLAPNGVVQQTFAACFNDMVKDAVPYPTIIYELAGALRLGLEADDWPAPLAPL